MPLCFKEVLQEIRNLLLATRGILPKIRMRSGGVHVQPVPRDKGIVGGDIYEFKTSENEITLEEATVLAKYDCGHICEASEIGGACEICGRVVCSKPGCLAFDVFSQVHACQKCYSIEMGVPVSILTKESNLLWKREVRKYLKSTERERLTQ
ncbi:MAG: hypothetical protein HY515_01775 [Candidatus Aenigmarchaeota archaeon]|nr:hypothetical protein [Candidatus Aenigmarchaeota archaeon]